MDILNRVRVFYRQWRDPFLNSFAGSLLLLRDARGHFDRALSIDPENDVAPGYAIQTPALSAQG